MKLVGPLTSGIAGLLCIWVCNLLFVVLFSSHFVVVVVVIRDGTRKNGFYFRANVSFKAFSKSSVLCTCCLSSGFISASILTFPQSSSLFVFVSLSLWLSPCLFLSASVSLSLSLSLFALFRWREWGLTDRVFSSIFWLLFVERFSFPLAYSVWWWLAA